MITITKKFVVDSVRKADKGMVHVSLSVPDEEEIYGKTPTVDIANPASLTPEQLLSFVTERMGKYGKEDELKESFAVIFLTEAEYNELRWCPGDVVDGTFIGEK